MNNSGLINGAIGQNYHLFPTLIYNIKSSCLDFILLLISCAMSNPSPIKIKESDRLDVFGKVVGKINSNDVPDYRF